MALQSIIKYFGFVLILVNSLFVMGAHASEPSFIIERYETGDSQVAYMIGNHYRLDVGNLANTEQTEDWDGLINHQISPNTKKNMRKWWAAVVILIFSTLLIYWDKPKPNSTTEDYKYHNEMVSGLRVLWIITPLVPLLLVLIDWFFK